MREIIHWIVALFAFPPTGHPTSASDWFFTVVGFIIYLARDLFLAWLGFSISFGLFSLVREAVTRPRHWYLTIKDAIQSNWDGITRFVGTAVIGIGGFLVAVWLLAKIWPILVWIFWAGLYAYVALFVLFLAIGLTVIVAEKLGLAQSFWSALFRWALWSSLFGIAFYVALFVGSTFVEHHFPEGVVTFLNGVPVFLVFGLVAGLIVAVIMRIAPIRILPTTLGTGAIRATIMGLAIGAVFVGYAYLSIQHQREAQIRARQISSALVSLTNQALIPYPREQHNRTAATTKCGPDTEAQAEFDKVERAFFARHLDEVENNGPNVANTWLHCMADPYYLKLFAQRPGAGYYMMMMAANAFNYSAAANLRDRSGDKAAALRQAKIAKYLYGEILANSQHADKSDMHSMQKIAAVGTLMANQIIAALGKGLSKEHQP